LGGGLPAELATFLGGSVPLASHLLWESEAFENNYLTEMCSGSEAGSYLRLIDFCITQL